MFFSLGVSMGALIMYSSYNDFRNDIFRYNYLYIILNLCITLEIYPLLAGYQICLCHINVFYTFICYPAWWRISLAVFSKWILHFCLTQIRLLPSLYKWWIRHAIVWSGNLIRVMEHLQNNSASCEKKIPVVSLGK